MNTLPIYCLIPAQNCEKRRRITKIYQTIGIAAACDIAGMKRDVYSGAGPVGANGIVPAGPIVDHDRPHDRGRFGATATAGRNRLVDA